MLNMTKAAGEYLNSMLMRAQAPAEAAVRIVAKPDGDGLMTTVDHERAGDQCFDCDGHTVLVLGSDVAANLSEQTLDVGDDGKRLVLA